MRLLVCLLSFSMTANIRRSHCQLLSPLSFSFHIYTFSFLSSSYVRCHSIAYSRSDRTAVDFQSVLSLFVFTVVLYILIDTLLLHHHLFPFILITAVLFDYEHSNLACSFGRLLSRASISSSLPAHFAKLCGLPAKQFILCYTLSAQFFFHFHFC